MADQYDVIVVGGGPGGYVAAIRAAQLGMKVACVEMDRLGGICNNWGCIPTKALLESASLLEHVRHAGDFGVMVGDIKGDLSIAMKRSRKVADQGATGVGFLFKKNKIDSISGFGRLAGNGKVDVEKDGKVTTMSAKHIIVATGSKPRDLPFLKIDEKLVWSSTGAMIQEAAPATLAIIGSGAIGMEFADVYAAFGSKVTILEALPRILPLEDSEVAAVVEKSYRKRGMEIFAGTKVTSAKLGKESVELEFETAKGEKKKVTFDRVLVAVGRAPLSKEIGLEKVGVKVDDRGFVVVDANLKTNVPGVYAIGDVAGPPLLAHKGSHEGVACVESIAGHARIIDYSNIPNCTYCHPEVASVGLTEEQAKAKGLDIKIGKFPWSANGRARTSGETDGFVKVIVDAKYGEILGAHIVGPHATELIAEFVVGRHLETTIEEMEVAIHPHPTLSEAIGEAALAATGAALHI